MKWPWTRPAVEHRSSYTDQIVTAILQSASGGGVRPAGATAALEQCATLYASALSACAVLGPSGVTRSLTADWRASVAASLIRSGQALFIIGADPVSGLCACDLVGQLGCARRANGASSWYYRCEIVGAKRRPRWETPSRGGGLTSQMVDRRHPPMVRVSVRCSVPADTGSSLSGLD